MGLLSTRPSVTSDSFYFGRAQMLPDPNIHEAIPKWPYSDSWLSVMDNQELE
jgi:hypothetical protein